MPTRNDRGAAAVELALLLPVLMLLVMGIVDFGIVFHQQVSLSGAAREGARYYALHNDLAGAAARAIDAAPSVIPAPTVAVCVGASTSTCTIDAACTPGDIVQVTTSTPVDLNIPFGPVGTITVTGRGVMRCGG